MPAIHDCNADSTGQWIVVNTHIHREQIAVDNLSRQGFGVYCPRVEKRIKHARRTRDVLRPLFPGYIFVTVDPEVQQWRPILSTLGVRTLIRCGEKLSFIDAGFVASLKAREIDGAVARPASPYKIGQQVRMASGPFDGLVATILEMDEKDRLVVLMDILNQTTKVKVDSKLVIAA